MSQETVKVLSVKQPWASFLLSGEDWSENRTWKTDYRGPLWIHASSTIDREECKFQNIDPKPLVTGAILGKVELVDMFDKEQDGLEARQFEIIDKYKLHPCGVDFMFGPYCWIVTNPQKLKHPIPAKGQLNLWKCEIEDVEDVEFEPATPLLNFPEPAPCKKIRVTLNVNGEEEPVVYVQEYRQVTMYFLKQYRTHIPMEKTSYQYKNKDAYFKAGCEKAWELFPEKFGEQ